MNASRLRSIIVKEFRQIGRDRQTLAILVFIPAFLLVMYGYALDLDASFLPTAVYDADGTAESRALVDHFFLQGASEFFVLVHRAEAPEEIDRLLLDGTARLGLVIPAGFGADLSAGRPASVQVLVDGVNASEAAAAQGYAETVVAQYAIEQREARQGRAALLPVDYRPRVWYNPELKSELFLLPGLIAFILMIITVISTALSIVRERERGSMEQLIVSPLRPLELIVGKLIPYAVLSLAATVLVLAASYALFALPVRGSLLWLGVATLLYLCGALGMGLVISTIANTQETAFFLAVVTTLLPTFILSGFVFPISNMPLPVQVVTHVVPARYYLVLLRGILLKGVGPEVLWPSFLLLAAFAILMLGIGTLRLRRLLG